MPDPERRTISATESPALFGVSPYATPWMLYQRFANGVDIDSTENNRMDWGKRMQPLLLAAAAEDLKLEVTPNPVIDGKDVYIRRGCLGCTRDGIVICPDRGPGAIETKCVFDYRVWMDTWSGGKAPPRHIEIQLQHQMLVGDGETPFRWGTLAVWLAGEMHYFEREPIKELWAHIAEETTALFRRVHARIEPDPFGAPVEAPLIMRLFPTIPEKVLDLSQDPAHVKSSEAVSLYTYHRTEKAGHEKGLETLRAELFALARDAEKVLLPCGVNFRIKKSGKGRTIDAYVPEMPLAPPVAESVLAGG